MASANKDIVGLREQILDNAHSAWTALNDQTASPDDVTFKVLTLASSQTGQYKARVTWTVWNLPASNTFIESSWAATPEEAYDRLLHATSELLQRLCRTNMLEEGGFPYNLVALEQGCYVLGSHA